MTEDEHVEMIEQAQNEAAGEIAIAPNEEPPPPPEGDAETEGAEPAGKPQTADAEVDSIPYERFQKVVAERNALKAERESLAQSRALLDGILTRDPEVISQLQRAGIFPSAQPQQQRQPEADPFEDDSPLTKDQVRAMLRSEFSEMARPIANAVLQQQDWHEREALKAKYGDHYNPGTDDARIREIRTRAPQLTVDEAFRLSKGAPLQEPSREAPPDPSRGRVQAPSPTGRTSTRAAAVKRRAEIMNSIPKLTGDALEQAMMELLQNP
jgi:hypothetical protein